MKKLFILIIGLLITFAPLVYAEIPGEYLSADLGAADLMAIARKYPTLFNTGAIVVTVFCLGYAIYYIFRKRKED